MQYMQQQCWRVCSTSSTLAPSPLLENGSTTNFVASTSTRTRSVSLFLPHHYRYYYNLQINLELHLFPNMAVTKSVLKKWFLIILPGLLILQSTLTPKKREFMFSMLNFYIIFFLLSWCTFFLSLLQVNVYVSRLFVQFFLSIVDIISTIEFDKYGGRVVLFERTDKKNESLIFALVIFFITKLSFERFNLTSLIL